MYAMVFDKPIYDMEGDDMQQGALPGLELGMLKLRTAQSKALFSLFFREWSSGVEAFNV